METTNNLPHIVILSPTSNDDAHPLIKTLEIVDS